MKYIVFTFIIAQALFSWASKDCESTFSKTANTKTANTKTINNAIILTRVLNSNNLIREEYTGIEGYIRFANKHYEGDMGEAYAGVYFALLETIKKPGDMPKNFDWRLFQGTTGELKTALDQILDKDGNSKEEFRGINGYLKFSDQYYDGDMVLAYDSIEEPLDAASISRPHILEEELKWTMFFGTTKDFRTIRKDLVIIDPINGNRLKEEWAGKDLKEKFAIKYTNGLLLNAYIQLSSIIKNKEIINVPKELDNNVVEDFEELPDQPLTKKEDELLNKKIKKLYDSITDSDGYIKEKYLYNKGSILFAKEHYKGDMEDAYQDISIFLNPMQFNQIGWRIFPGTVEGMYKLKDLIYYPFTKIVRLGIKGHLNYLEISDQYFKSDMVRAWHGIAFILNEETVNGVKDKIEWIMFTGTTGQFRKMRSSLIDSDGDIEKDALGNAGYIRFADKYAIGNMERAYNMAMSVVHVPGDNMMDKLHWGYFEGTTEEYKDKKYKMNK